MMKKITLLSMILALTFVQAQKSWEPGYYIDSNGRRVEGEIRAISLERANLQDADFEYRTGPDATVQKIKASGITEIGISNDIKLRKYSVMLDDSNLSEHNLDHDKTFEMKPATIFLNVLIEGAASLYEYESVKGTKYFYRVEGKQDVPRQLLYKKYSPKEMVVRENPEFRQQLTNDLAVAGQAFGDFANVRYKKEALLEIFSNYNSRMGKAGSTDFRNEKKVRGRFNFSVMGGVGMAQFTFESPEYTAPSQQEFFWGIGAEVEFQNSRRTWGAFAQIMYAPVSTKSSRTRDYSEFNDMLVRSDFAADLNNLHVRVGPRYYFSSESRVRFYADASFGVVLPSGTMSLITYIIDGDQVMVNRAMKVEPGPDMNAGVGLGCIFKNRIGVELRYHTTTSPDTERQFEIGFSSLMCNLRYTFK